MVQTGNLISFQSNIIVYLMANISKACYNEENSGKELFTDKS
jgi:hypothetical protein